MSVFVDLKYIPREWQKKCHAERQRFTVLALHRRAGKTELAIMELIDRALKFKLPLGMFFYVAPFLKQAKTIAWARLKQRLEPLRIANAIDINEAELFIKFKHNGALIRVYGADNPDGMRGVGLDGVVIDEVAQIKPEVWDDIIQPTLSDRKGWALFIGTPHGVNMFSRIYYRAQELPDWYANRYTVYDTDALDTDEVERLKRDMTEASFAREYLCDFSAAGDDQLIALSDVEDAARRINEPDSMNYAPRIIGVDPARFGDDASTIICRQGLQMFDPDVMHGLDNMELVGRIAAKIKTWEPDAVFIDSGNGSGVIDRLRQMGHEVIEVNFGSKAMDAHYANKRAEMWFLMRDWIKAGGAIPNHQQLKQDLATPVYRHDKLSRLILESKDEIKARGLPSPDIGDGLALTFAYPVAKKSLTPKAKNNPIDYDPMAVAHSSLTRNNTSYDPYANIR